MRFLLDKDTETISRKIATVGYVEGQLLTPLTNYAYWGGRYGIDNGAYSYFSHKKFSNLLARNEDNKDSCLFVAVPDVVGNGRRTLEIWHALRYELVGSWPAALVAQDGMEDLPIPWEETSALFIGGTDQFKNSQAVVDLVKTAHIFKKHVHVGRVNTWSRYRKFAELHAHTCDGSGASQYDHMLEGIAAEMRADCSQIKFDFTGIETNENLTHDDDTQQVPAQ